jgi:peptidoglycan/xylan/chitin deacetylase (PgdA/CDA1 family)
MNPKEKTVLLSFDIEEFDMPLEYGVAINFEDQIKRSKEGTGIILDILQKHKIAATFFSTTVFASNAVEVIRRICLEGHELASHGYHHSKFQIQDLRESKLALEKISQRDVRGFRMARMMPVNDDDIIRAGYLYNSSLNPTYLPGRYNNLFKPRTLFRTKNLFQIPASATPLIRLPLFWLSFHNLPLWFYKAACKTTMNKDAYLNLYFHPWEFIEIKKPEYGLPAYVTKNSGPKMVYRFDKLLHWMKEENFKFCTFSNFIGCV